MFFIRPFLWINTKKSLVFGMDKRTVLSKNPSRRATRGDKNKKEEKYKENFNYAEFRKCKSF